MLNDSFRLRYEDIPVAVHERAYRTNSPSGGVILHNHREFELLIVTNGEAVFYIGDETVKVKTGETVLVPPYVPHRAQIGENSGFSNKCICFDLTIFADEELKKKLEAGTLTTPFHIKQGEQCTEEVYSLIDAAYTAYTEMTAGRALAVKGYLMMLFSLLQAENMLTAKITSKKNNKFCFEMINFIESRYFEQPSSKQAADSLFMSHGYFCRQFKANFGESFNTYLCKYRIEKSKELLRKSDLGISQIAERVGFSDFSYFSKMFRTYQGITASVYRKNHSA